MTEHPEFPQESPATKYIIEQVSKIEDAQACGTGYYKSLSKVLGRLDKTDIAINQLQQNITELKKIIDFEGVAQSIDSHTAVMATTVKKGLTENNEIAFGYYTTALAEIRKANQENSKQILELIKKFDKHISDIDKRIAPPLWKIYAYSFLALCVGAAYGHYFWR